MRGIASAPSVNHLGAVCVSTFLKRGGGGCKPITRWNHAVNRRRRARITSYELVATIDWKRDHSHSRLAMAATAATHDATATWFLDAPVLPTVGSAMMRRSYPGTRAPAAQHLPQRGSSSAGWTRREQTELTTSGSVRCNLRLKVAAQK